MDIDENTGQGTPPPDSSPTQQQQEQQHQSSVTVPPQQNNEIEQSLLSQFSCLGTTDHDELVNELQRLFTNQLNYATARFFLEMNNWNLQEAVGCYLDFNSNQRLPSMQVVADVTVGLGEAVTPNTQFVQSWEIRNSGDEAWPLGCFLKCTSNQTAPDVHVDRIVQPNETYVINITIVSPPELGSFQTKWRLCTRSGSYFGDTIWSIVQVNEAGTLALTQQLSQLRTSNTSASTQTVQGCENINSYDDTEMW